MKSRTHKIRQVAGERLSSIDQNRQDALRDARRSATVPFQGGTLLQGLLVRSGAIAATSRKVSPSRKPGGAA